METTFNETVRIFSEAGIGGLITFSFVLFIMVFWRALKLISDNEAKRDEYELKRSTETSRLFQHQIKIMEESEKQFAKLNDEVIGSIKERSALVEKMANSNNALADAIKRLGYTLGEKNNEISNTLKSIAIYMVSSKDSHDKIMENLQNILTHLEKDENDTRIIDGVAEKISARIDKAERDGGRLLGILENSLNRRLESIDGQISIIWEFIKNEGRGTINNNSNDDV